ncbi:MAG: MerR family transcriptional regulator [Pseudomonadota bacterium]|nr:MerR family transcriptional regulator [Pseudomonadota bacterium]
MTVNELANLVGVSVDSVRHYTKLGLLSPSRDPANGYRRYAPGDVKRLRFIRAAQSLGFKLAEIKQILADSDAGRSPCPEVRRIMDRRIEENRARLAELTALQTRMEAACREWGSMPDGDGSGEIICPLIEAVGDGDTVPVSV